MDIKKGRRKSFDIEFVIVTLENLEEVAAWSGGTVGGDEKNKHVRLQDKAAINAQQTKAFIGDVVVKSSETKTYKKFTRKAFNKAFEEIHTQVIHRDAGDGKFISAEDAAADPEGTVSETRTAAEKMADEVPGVAYMHPSNTELPRDADPS